MTQSLADLSVSELKKIVDRTKRTFSRRDEIWHNRRRVRFRQMEQELRSLPLSNRVGQNQALLIFQTEEVNQEVHRRVKRLIANKPRIEVVVYDSRDEIKRQAQNLKDALKALWRWMNRGKIPPERLATEYQQADGLGWFKLDFIASYADDALAPYDIDYLTMEEAEFMALGLDEAYVNARREFQEEMQRLLANGETVDADLKAYESVTDRALRKCDPPFRLSAPDPMSIYYQRDGDAITLVIEYGKRHVSALLEAFGDRGLRLVNNRFVLMPTGGSEVLSESTIPERQELGSKYDDLCEYIEIRTRKEIVILIRHPQLKDRASRNADEDGYVKLTFENPFGPYSTGYIMVPADITGSHDPADEFQPPVLGVLSLAQPLNVLETARLSAALDKALAGKYVKMPDAQTTPPLSSQQADKTPTVKDGKPIPVIPGEVKREEAVNIDLDKSEAFLIGMLQNFRFNEVLAGDAQSSDSGHKLAIQVSQADTQLVPYQNARAEAMAEVLMSCLYAVQKIGHPVYVKELPEPDLVRMGKFSNEQPVRALLPEYWELDFNLIVTIGSETPVTKFAKWAALQQRYQAGTLSFETLMEQSDVENVSDEIARIFEGQTLTAVMQQAIPVIVKMIGDRVLAKLSPQPPQPVMPQVPGQGGNESGGGMPGAQASTPIAGIGRLPGVGLSPAGPTTGEYGPRVNEGAGEMEVPT
jgi:hypothetical protein